MSDAVIRVSDLGKQYNIGAREAYSTLREAIMHKAAAPLRMVRALKSGSARASSGPSTFWALRDVSFDLKRGDVLGVIGANGAGKSTLLKLLSRITAPTTGRIEIDGRVGSLLEVGTGFHAELTGRENIFLNGAILGMQKAEIHRRFDEIVAFSGVEKFIDTPVKRYSSGMYMRLAFAVAAHLDTEILVVDEVLAVGDAAFQLKCLNKMSDVSASGRTILFVSHNMEAVTKLCSRGILLNQGTIAHQGTPRECIDVYLAIAKEKNAAGDGIMDLKSHPGRTKHHNGPVQLRKLTILGENNLPTSTPMCGEAVKIVLDYDLVDNNPQEVTFAVTFSNFYNNRLTTCRSHDSAPEPLRVTSSGSMACSLPKFPFVPGFYRLAVGVNTEAGHSDGVYDAIVIEVVGSSYYRSGSVPARGQGEMLIEHDWNLLQKS